MINDFFNWFKRYSRSKFFKLVLFFAIFCIISLCRKCDVHASWRYINDTNGGMSLTSSDITYNFTELEYNSDTGTLMSVRDKSVVVPWKFDQYSNTSASVSSDDFLFLKNIVFHYRYNVNVTIDSSDFKYLGFGYRYFFNWTGGTEGYFNFLKNPTVTQRQTLFNNMSGFAPYYAEYLDSADNTWKTVPTIKVLVGSDVPNYNIVLGDIPIGTTLREIKIYVGTEKNYYGSLTDVNTHIRTENNSINNSYFNYYTRPFTWSTYRNADNLDEYGFLGYIPNVPGNEVWNLQSTTTGTNSYNGFENITSHGDTIPSGYGVTTYNITGTLQDIIDNATSDDEEQKQEIIDFNKNYVIIGGATDDDLNTMDSNYSSAVDSFTSSSSSTNFTGLFSSLFAYPIQKLYDMKDIDLYNENYVNLGLCTGSNNITGDWNDRLQIRIAKPGTESDTWYYELPCPHYDIYYQIRHGNYSLMGSNSGMLYNGHITFEFIWRSVLRGLLIYWLFVTCLGIYKYILDPEDTKVEVLDL